MLGFATQTPSSQQVFGAAFRLQSLEIQNCHTVTSPDSHWVLQQAHPGTITKHTHIITELAQFQTTPWFQGCFLILGIDICMDLRRCEHNIC